METIAFGQRREKGNNGSVSNIQKDTPPEDIIMIDSQIELKVRGELPETKMLNAATEYM